MLMVLFRGKRRNLNTRATLSTTITLPTTTTTTTTIKIRGPTPNFIDK